MLDMAELAGGWYDTQVSCAQKLSICKAAILQRFTPLTGMQATSEGGILQLRTVVVAV